ncbi:NADH pyrophosphatase [Microbacterium aurum]|uniref:NAD(+) diphosphatase n=1 Tax=Microbacterium aurum TaxID=36805 RepID=A0A1P8U7M4_9MICO|nr:NAD(+) diphosphatase [Microbacterium aurum]APZ34118.1 NADH pyrophosphatase [Microbacterium aurum]MBM7827919.1 NAD+ diphosphatase [Microbacterium aurum]
MTPSPDPDAAASAPPLARAGIDRAAEERAEAGLIDRLRGNADTRVVAVHGDRAPLTADGSLRTVAVEAIRDGVKWGFLGRDETGRALLVAAAGAQAPSPLRADPGEGAPGAAPDGWGALRAVGGEMPAVDAGVFVEAVALGGWLVAAPFCSACGGRTEVRSAGWSRHCPSCGREHFPRTDPAVIVAVTTPDRERLLLGKNALWADRNMYSTFAGFVEAGESLEATIVREVAEEAGVTVSAAAYRGSQAWPYPRSLMLGFHATAADPEAARADGEEIVDVRWFTRAELTAAFAGEADFALPGTASIAHRLIADWVAMPE